MVDNYVGAGILSIITESLYDNPIVVFREYVQNSVDSIFNENDQDLYEIKMWKSNTNLFFLDNGKGIAANEFQDKMIKIGGSNKRKKKNLGYKGIGRLSGVPYCEKLIFVNILDYSSKKAQLYSIDCARYVELKNKEQDKNLSFSELMRRIGTFVEVIELNSTEWVFEELNKYSNILSKTNTGFLVVLQNISQVLNSVIEADGFKKNLQWLLPVDFNKEIYNSDKKELFEELTDKTTQNVTPIKYCSIFFNDEQLFRPITPSMFRHYVCKNNFKYAVGFHTFNRDRLVIEKNEFTGIRIYIDNMLLCTEEELLRSLDNYGLLTHTFNGQVQSVRGIGAMIYITDKVNISANARRTFIEVTDNDSLDFLKLLAEFVNTIYDTRYALSNYASAKAKQEQNVERLQKLKNDAIENLQKLAKEEVQLPDDFEEIDFNNLSATEKKQIIKKKLSTYFDAQIKKFIKGLSDFSVDSALEDFKTWLESQKN